MASAGPAHCDITLFTKDRPKKAKKTLQKYHFVFFLVPGSQVLVSRPCGRLSKNGPHRLIYLNAHSSEVALFEKD